jgi:RNA polymerase sigma-70 factor (ECF subfamily)
MTSEGGQQSGPRVRPTLDAAEAALCDCMLGYLAGQIDSFDALYDRLAGRLHGYLLTLCRDAAVADDLLQDTFLQMHRSRRTYQPGRAVTPWAFAIARHVFLMHRRQAARRARGTGEFAAERPRVAASKHQADVIDDRLAIQRALRRVPADHRDAVLLHYVFGWSFAEIAARLGIRANAARTRAFRGLKRMRDVIGVPSR